LLKIIGFWDVTLCNVICHYQRFWGTFYLHLQHRRVSRKLIAIKGKEKWDQGLEQTSNKEIIENGDP
jgi:hypothetical protein